MTNVPTGTEGAATEELSERDRFIAGLRAVADFYEANPTMPFPRYPHISVHTEGDDEQRAEQVRAAAVLLGADAVTSRGGHFVADRSFGPIGVRVIHIPSEVMADYEARQSYAANIRAARGGVR